MRWAALVLAASVATPAWGWGCDGHRIVALIAWARLDEPVRAAVTGLLARHPVPPENRGCRAPSRNVLADVAMWADAIRDEEPDTAPWHYVEVPRDAGVFYVAVRYREVLSRPVRVQPAGCGCDDTACEYSRWKDGYEFGLLDECPDDHQKPPSIDSLFRGPLPDCPECASSPWVVLARVEVEADGTITSIDNCVCRRLVASLAGAWWKCSGDHCDEGRIKVEGRSADLAEQDFVRQAYVGL